MGALLCRRIAAALFVAGVSVAASATTATAPELDARVSHETRQVMASGVTRVDIWQERLVRRGNQVWTERIRPAAAHDVHAHGAEPAQAEHIGHRHFDADTSARWLTLASGGKVEVRFVDRAHRIVVDVPSAEFGTVGFDGRYDAAASIVPPSVLATMKPGARTASGERWYTDRSAGWSHRVLWSEARQIALRVESERDDRSMRRVVVVQPQVTAKVTPWSALGGYTPKHYDDFMD